MGRNEKRALRYVKLKRAGFDSYTANRFKDLGVLKFERILRLKHDTESKLRDEIKDVLEKPKHEKD